MKKELDFTLLPDLTKGHFALILGKEIENNMSRFVETYERVNGAILFSSAYGCTLIPRTNQQSEAFFRASLAEFVSMEETLERDLLKLKINKKSIKINDSKNPLLHIIRELRNLEIHLKTSNLLRKKRKALWADKEIDFSYDIINSIEIKDFNSLRNAKYYKEDDIKEMLKWFNNAQIEWGVRDLVFRTVRCFCLEIIRTY